MGLRHLRVLVLWVGYRVRVSNDEELVGLEVSEADHLDHPLFLEHVVVFDVIICVESSQPATVEVVHSDWVKAVSSIRHGADEVFDVRFEHDNRVA